MSRTTRRTKGYQIAAEFDTRKMFHRDIQWCRYNEGTKRHIRQHGVRSTYRQELHNAIRDDRFEDFYPTAGLAQYLKAWSWGI